MTLFFIALIMLVFGSFVFQVFFLFPVIFLHGAAILFVPSIYFYGCLSLPFPLMLALTLVTGLLHDLFLIPQGSHLDFTVGTSILIYLVPGLIMHGFRPLFLRHRWEIHCLLAEICALLTPFLLLAEYAILSFQRHEFFLSDAIVWRTLGPGLISLVIAPCVFFILTPISHALRYRPGLPELR